MKKTAFLFPGQGSQHVGMGKDIEQAYPEAQTIFNRADTILQEDFSDLCFNGPEDVLNDTFNTQPALYICSIALLKALQTHIDIRADVLAGHSLGEFTALTVANAFSFEDGLRLVRERARLMREAGEQNPGAMAAILGLDVPALHKICVQATEQAGKPVVIANDNCPGQVVIAGDISALEIAMQLATENGARRALRLAVSIAAHSPLMHPASAEFNLSLNEAPIVPTRIPVYGNVNATTLDTVDMVRDELAQQLTQMVRWTETIQTMIANGVERFIEIGSGEVLTGLGKRIDRSVERIAINSVETLQKFVAENSG